MPLLLPTIPSSARSSSVSFLRVVPSALVAPDPAPIAEQAQRAQAQKAGRLSGAYGSNADDFDQTAETRAGTDQGWGGAGRGKFGEAQGRNGPGGFSESAKGGFERGNWGGGRAERGPTRDRWGNPLHDKKIKVIEGALIAKSVATADPKYAVGDRVFHQKFGNGTVAEVEGEKLTIDFDRAGRKRVLDGFVNPAG